MIHMVKSECLKAENENEKKNIDNDRYLSTDQFFNLIKTLFPTKLEVSFARLQKVNINLFIYFNYYYIDIRI